MNYTVTQVNNYIKGMFEQDCMLNNIYVRGEVSNCKYHSSGHIYFTLKDEYGQIACVMFAGMRRGLSFHMTEGQSVIVYGKVAIYERDGKYQLYASSIEPDGMGLLYMRFEELKKILSLKGYFDEDKKKAIPMYATKIGVITASTGAALQDIINITKRRNPYVNLYLFPTQVQGEGAAEKIASAIRKMDTYNLDVCIVGRGGGSIEDLWAFNEKVVATAVYECNTPIISAVGHETDTTIIDYVADLRAPTPSAAAELAVFDYKAFETKLNNYKNQLNSRMDNIINNKRLMLDNMSVRLDHLGPSYKIMQLRQYLTDLYDKLDDSMKRVLVGKRHELDLYIEKLNALSPLNRLKSGYGLVYDLDNKPVCSINNIKCDDEINIALIDGNIKAKVTDVKKNNYSWNK
ncbi:MAG: exodeoxyribonuclease VII large subunit [Lachnospiraceae bacterium]|nr:exodeoxyribonuclease VII large subunit [Lachnospiraceae bacterium]